MQRLKIDVSKIEKSYLFKGKSGTYLDATLMDNREGPDQYGNDGFIVQDVGKENREKGIKGPIIGNWKHVGGKQQPAPQQRQKPASTTLADDHQEEDDIPF